MYSTEIILNDAGKMIEKWYYELMNKFPDIKCHQMIVMPNHFHCIIENVGTNLHVCPKTVRADLRVCPKTVRADLRVCPETKLVTTQYQTTTQHRAINQNPVTTIY
jgi:hypothetical protein